MLKINFQNEFPQIIISFEIHNDFSFDFLEGKIIKILLNH